MMIELFFIACLAGSDGRATDQCEDRALLYSNENLTPYQCSMDAQAELAKWYAANPGYVVMKYGCRNVDPSAKEEDA